MKQTDMHDFRRAGGFTLIELMVALTLSLFLVGGVLLMYGSGRAATIDSQQLSRVQENVRFASDYMIRDIRNAGFRDELFLKNGHEQQIRQQYARVSNDGQVLTIRYAGRGHCAEAFDEFRVLENEYSLNAGTGELQCRGRSIAATDSGASLLTDEPYSNPVGLVSGLTGISFQLICPDGTTTCDCNFQDSPESSCIGARIGLEFESLRDVDGSGDFQTRSTELTATFRNMALFRIYGGLDS